MADDKPTTGQVEAPKVEKTLQQRIEEMIKAGRINIHTQEVKSKDKLIGSAPVLHAAASDIEALTLIHERVGGLDYIVRTVNTDFSSTVATSARNYVNNKDKPVTFAEALKDKLGLVGEGFYSKLRYGHFQEVDSKLKEYNKRLKEIEDELKECKVKGDRERAKELFKEQSEVEAKKSERNFDIQFGSME